MFNVRRISMVAASVIAALFAASVDTLAQGGLPNPYRPVQGLADGGGPYVPGGGWAKLPGGRQMGPPASVDIDIDGESLWAIIRCDETSPVPLAQGGRFGIDCLTPEGKINLTQLKFATAEEPTAPAPAGAAPPARNVRIDRVVFADSRLDFSDHFIKPNYRADVGGLGGTVTQLSSAPESRGVVDLKGSYDKTSPVIIAIIVAGSTPGT